MTLFLANRANLQNRRLHERIKNRLGGTFESVRRRRSEPREAGPYRVVGRTNPRHFLEVDDYPATDGRVEIGVHLRTSAPSEHYWINWIEPERGLLVGWHQDETHDDLGPVHLQVNDEESAVDRCNAAFIDSHPIDVVEARLGSLQDVITAVEWERGRPVGFDTAALADA